MRGRTKAIAGSALAVAVAVVTAFATGMATKTADLVAGLLPGSPAEPFVSTVVHDRQGEQWFILREALREGPDALALLTGFPSHRAWEDFLHRTGAAPRSRTAVTLDFVGRENTTARILNVAVIINSSEPPYSGTAIHAISQGDPSVAEVRVDLDEPGPPVRDARGERYVVTDHPVDLTNAKHFTFRIGFTARRSSHTWLLRVDYSDKDGGHRVFLDSTGKQYAAETEIPADALFRLTGTAPAYAVTYEDNHPSKGFRVR